MKLSDIMETLDNEANIQIAVKNHRIPFSYTICLLSLRLLTKEAVSFGKFEKT